jgi:hypothetical protein
MTEGERRRYFLTSPSAQSEEFKVVSGAVNFIIRETANCCRGEEQTAQ